MGASASDPLTAWSVPCPRTSALLHCHMSGHHKQSLLRQLYHRRVSPGTIQQYNQVRSQKRPTWDNQYWLVWVSLHHRGSRLRQTISHEITMLQLSLAWDNPANNQFTPPQLSFVGWGHSYNLQRRSLVTKVMITLSTINKNVWSCNYFNIVGTLTCLLLPWLQQ